MITQNEPIIYFDSQIYSAKAIKYAVYDLGLTADIINDVKNNLIQVKILSLPNDFPCDDIEQKLKRTALDHQIRFEVEKDYGAIRKLILTQAFFPCDNLEAITNAIEL